MAFFTSREEMEEINTALETFAPKEPRPVEERPETIRAPQPRSLRQVLVDEWINMSKEEKLANVVGLFADPQVLGLGMIAGAKGPVLRAAMRAETVARGKAPAGGIGKLIHDVVSGSWWHGRKSYPKRGESFAEVRGRTGNLGEPMGISLSKVPGVAMKFAGELPYEEVEEKLWAKVLDAYKRKFGTIPNRPMKLDEIKAAVPEAYKKYEDITGRLGLRPISRAFPLVGGPPAERIIPGWIGPGTEEAQEVLKELYSKAVVKSPTSILPLERTVSSYAESVGRDRLNRLVTEGLQEKGYKGILYSPARYGEHELRMFDPKDVLSLGKVIDPASATYALEHLPGREKVLKNWVEALEQGASGSLRDVYSQIGLKRLLQEAGKSEKEIDEITAKWLKSMESQVRLQHITGMDYVTKTPKGWGSVETEELDSFLD